MATPLGICLPAGISYSQALAVFLAYDGLAPLYKVNN